MAYALRNDGFAVSQGMVRLRETDGQTPLPSEPSQDGVYVSADELEREVQRVKADRQTIARAALLLRADAIDPTHGAAFRNAVIGHTITLDVTSNNMIVYS